MKIILTYVDSEELAEKIAETLLQEKLAACVGFWPGKSRYWWKGKIDEEIYFNISAFTKLDYKDQIISEVEKDHSDDTPIIAFFKIDYGNKKFLEILAQVKI